MIAQHYKDMLGAKSVIRQISEWSTARGAQIGYDNVFDYSLGNPSVPCPPQFTAACENLLQSTDPVTLHGYTPTLTLPSARKAVAESLNQRFGMDYTADHIFMTSGAAGALAHALRCVAVPGQNIVTFAPFFPEYKPYVEGAGLTLRVTPPRCADFQIDFAAFAPLVDENTAAVLINSPNNPSGTGHNCPSSLIQMAVERCLAVTSDLSVYETNMNLLYDELCALGFTVVKPDGTFYIFPKALEEDAKAFCRKAQKYDLALVPGDSFGCPGYFRMAYCIGTEKVRRSFAALERFVAAEYGVTKQ